MKKELTFNEIFAYLEAFKTVNVKGFKINYAIDKNVKALENEAKDFHKALEREKPEKVKELEKECKKEGEAWDKWNEDVGEMAKEKAVIEIHLINQDDIPRDIDTKTYRILSLFIED